MASTRTGLFPRNVQNNMSKRTTENEVVKPQKRTRTAFGDITNKENVAVNLKGNVKKGGLAALKPKQITAVAKSRAKVETKKENQTSKPEATRVLPGRSLPPKDDSSSSRLAPREIEGDARKTASTVSSKAKKTCINTEVKLLCPFDVENAGDPIQAGDYVVDIFDYFRTLEPSFPIHDYLREQPAVTATMRAVLVDWMVEVQENFELNHETLYLAVKLVDLFLCKEKVASKERFQLIGATALFIAAKFDERYPPVVDDFVFVCADSYSRDELLQMERCMLRTVGFRLFIPLSYRFLRRYSRCARCDITTLTLSRYILEMSLMDIKFCCIDGSLLAAACLYVARRMRHIEDAWNETLEKVSTYDEEAVREVCPKLTRLLKKCETKSMQTIRTKYSHEIFHCVAKTQLLPLEDEMESSGNSFNGEPIKTV